MDIFSSLPASFLFCCFFLVLLTPSSLSLQCHLLRSFLFPSSPLPSPPIIKHWHPSFLGWALALPLTVVFKAQRLGRSRRLVRSGCV